MNTNREWMQDLFDLMANKPITLLVSGEIGDVWADLRIHIRTEPEPKHKKGILIAEVYGAEDFESAMRELMEKAREQK